MIGRTDEQQPVVPIEAVQLVEEEGTVGVVNEGVQVLEDDDARRELSRFLENIRHGALLAFPAAEGFYVERIVSLRVTFLHDHLHTDGLSVPCAI